MRAVQPNCWLLWPTTPSHKFSNAPFNKLKILHLFPLGLCSYTENPTEIAHKAHGWFNYVFIHITHFHTTAEVFFLLKIFDIRLFYVKYQRELVDKEKRSNDLAGSRSEENLGHALCPLERQSDEAFISVSLLQSQTSEISTVSPGKHTPLPVRTIVSVMQPKDTQGVPHHGH